MSGIFAAHLVMEKCPGKVYVGVSKKRALILPFPSTLLGVGAKVSHCLHTCCAGDTEAREHRNLLNNIQLTSSREGTVQEADACLAISGP